MLVGYERNRSLFRRSVATDFSKFIYLLGGRDCSASNGLLFDVEVYNVEAPDEAALRVQNGIFLGKCFPTSIINFFIEKTHFVSADMTKMGCGVLHVDGENGYTYIEQLWANFGPSSAFCHYCWYTS